MLDCEHDAAEHKLIDNISANPAACQFGEESVFGDPLGCIAFSELLIRLLEEKRTSLLFSI